jgi:hypothetical protein
MAASDLTKTAFIFKTTYANRKVPDTLKRRHPWWSRIYKSTDWTGANDFRYAVMDADAQGIGGTMAGAQSNNVSGPKGNQFSAARRKRFGEGSIDGEARAAAEDDNGSLMRLVKTNVDGHLNEHEDTLAHALFRDGTGARGQVNAVPVGNAIILTKQTDVRWFKRGMTLISSPNANGSTPRNGGATMEVTKVSYADSTITVDSLVTGTTTSDYLFRDTEESATSAPMDGMQSIIPATAGTFRSVDCTVDRERYAGWYLNDPNTSTEENVGELISRINSYGVAESDMLVILNPFKAWEIAKKQQAKVVYDGGSAGKTLIGFKAFEFQTPMGSAMCLPDPDCDITDGWVVVPNTWEYKGLKPAPHIIMDDDNKFLRAGDEDAIEYRSRSMGNLICYCPAVNGRFRLNA